MKRLETILKMTLSIVIIINFASSLTWAQDKAEFFQQALRNLPPATGPTDDPPPQPAIGVAEWEPATGVLIRYPLAIPIALVAEMAEGVEVMSVVNNISEMQSAIEDYLRAGIDTSRCTFLITGFSSTPWTRDFGPWYIFNGNDAQGIIDNIYYGGIPCDRVPRLLGDTLSIPVYFTGLNAEGGNYMTDGMGRALTTTYTYWGNSQFTPEQIDGIFEEYLGISSLITTPHPWGTAVPHIDTHAKLIDPGCMIVIQLDPPNPTLEANVAYWSNLISGYGRPYEIIRVPGSGYSNSLFLNNRVFLALNGSANDSLALATFQAALPGYEVQGFTHPGWGALDALHCRTHEMPDRYMLRIVHVPAFDQVNNAGGYLIKAKIHRYSNMPFINGTPVVMWKLQGASTYNTMAMTALPADSFSAYIPYQTDNSIVQYYLHVEDNSGRSENHPYIGPGNPHDFSILPEIPLTVDLAPQSLPIIIAPGGGSFNYTLTITNDCTIPVKFDGWLGATLPDGSDYQTFLRYNITLAVGQTMTRNMSQTIPGRAPSGNYTYWLKVGLNPQNTIWGQDSFPFSKSGVGESSLAEGDWSISEWGETTSNVSMMPLGYYLSSNYPNPFNPLTSMAFSLPQAQRVNLSVYDAQGRRVMTLVDGYRAEGVHEVTWDASDMASGIYFCRIEAGNFSAVKKMMLVK